MLLYPKGGGRMWFHIRTRAMCQEVFKHIRGKYVKISCFAGSTAKSFDTTKESPSVFLAYMLNNYGAGKLKVRIWTKDIV